MPSFDEEFQKAYSYHQSAKFGLAESIYNDLLKIQPNNKDLILLLGTLHLQSKDLIKSENFFKKYLAIDNSNYLAFQNLGVLSNAKGDYKQARNFLEKSISLNPKNYHAQFYLSKSLYELDQFDDAYKILKSYLKNIDDNSEAFFDMGNICFSLNKIEDSISYYDKSLEIKPKYHEALANKALALSKIPNYSEAIILYKRAIFLNDCNLYRTNLANLMKHIGLYDEAIKLYKKSLALDPNNKEAFIDLNNLYQSANQFNDIDLDELKKIISNLNDGYDPFSLLYLFDDLKLQLSNAKKYTLKKFGSIAQQKNTINLLKEEKIRIVYVSADFRNHPLARLIQDVIKKHDRKNFEIFAISLKKSDDDIHKEIIHDFDEFFDGSSCADKEILEYCEAKKFHIGINLGGYTRFARTALFAHRLAPIQISFLGFPGTMGSDFMDYIISDKHVIPLEFRKYYSEKILYLPFYQPNNKFIKKETKKIENFRLNFPKDKFIFCCFNNAFKINQKIFDSWIRILKQVPNSVFVIYVKTEIQKINMVQYFQSQNIQKNRLIFTKKLPYESFSYLLSQCDLFLDTFPYNAGSTAQDALMAGLPVLTLTGETYSSRMCTSILKTANLSELCSKNFDEYESIAISLATDINKLNKIKEKLNHAYTETNMNIDNFIKFYEAGLKEALLNFHHNKNINHIVVKEN